MPTRRLFTTAGLAMAMSPWVVIAQPRPTRAPADQRDPTMTQARLEALLASCQAPAMAAAAQRRAGSTKVWASGVRRAGSEARVTAHDAWHIGSISKSFLATLSGRLVEAGKLRWDDTLGAALAREFPELPAAYRDATLLHLLSHRAGLVDNLSLPQMRAFDASEASEANQRRAFLQSAFALPPVGRVGEKTLYSNVGYIAAAAMIEARTGANWMSLMRREVFRPLGLASAGFGPPGRPGALDQPVGHGPFFDQPYRPHLPGEPNADLPLVMAPAGRIHMSLPDLITYLAAHRDQTAFLKPATWQMLHTPHFDGEYALGWNTRPDGTFTHDGSNLLWYAIASFNPRSGVAAAAAANDGRTSVWNAVGDAVRQAGSAV
jgi:CubicO group peptidase (beta-lactamase class C family)